MLSGIKFAKKDDASSSVKDNKSTIEAALNEDVKKKS